jgi:hypothetical protein
MILKKKLFSESLQFIPIESVHYVHYVLFQALPLHRTKILDILCVASYVIKDRQAADNREILIFSRYIIGAQTPLDSLNVSAQSRARVYIKKM